MNRTTVITILLTITALLCFVVPKPKYQSLNILEKISIPAQFDGWTSTDFSQHIKINLQDDRYNFINEVFARLYKNPRGERLLFLVLDAGNFHNPKICFNASGYTVKELGEVTFRSEKKPITANALYMDKADGGQFMYYWLCLDKKIVGWTSQKMLEFWASLFNRKKAGLMVRIEIPGKERHSGYCRDFAQTFIRDLSEHLSPEEKDYLFGRDTPPERGEDR